MLTMRYVMPNNNEFATAPLLRAPHRFVPTIASPSVPS